MGICDEIEKEEIVITVLRCEVIVPGLADKLFKIVHVETKTTTVLKGKKPGKEMT